MDTLLSPGFGLVFWSAIAFLVVLWILKKFAWGPILGALQDRESSIEASLKAAEEARKEMADLKADNERILNEARAERNEIIKEAKELKESIINEAKDKSREEAAKIIEAAKADIQNEKMAAITDIKNQAGLMAIEIAKQVLKKELKDNEAQEKYVDELINDFKLN
ncbi:MAG: F0F1 ATP synthase subunit B [Chitinophagaceae bacterium]|nr:MAG: F0F1 ATP synthase subunit B [Chitinophagaceae bacterium]